MYRPEKYCPDKINTWPSHMLTHSEIGLAPYPAPGADGNCVLSVNVLSVTLNLASGNARERDVRENYRWHSGTVPV